MFAEKVSRMPRTAAGRTYIHFPCCSSKERSSPSSSRSWYISFITSLSFAVKISALTSSLATDSILDFYAILSQKSLL